MRGIACVIDATTLPDVVPLGADEVVLTDEVADVSLITTHRHSYIEIIYFKEGHGHQVIDDVCYEIAPGTVTILLPHNIHEIIPDSGSRIVQRRCAFDPSLLMKATGSLNAYEELFPSYSDPCPIFRVGESDRERVEHLFDEVKAAAEGQAFGTMSASFVAMRLLVWVLRNQDSTSAVMVRERTSSLVFWRALHYLFSHAGEKKLDLAWLARHFHFDDKAFQDFVFDHFDMAFRALLSEARANRAASLLLAFPELQITAIGSLAGYSSDATFFRSFGKRFDLSPREFRERYLFRTTPISPAAVPCALTNDVLFHVYCNYQDDLKIAEVAERFGVSDQQLNRECRSYLGISFGELLSLVRVEVAKGLLGATNRPLEVVAKQSGFSSPKSLSQAFRKRMDCTPAEYRKALKALREETG